MAVFRVYISVSINDVFEAESEDEAEAMMREVVANIPHIQYEVIDIEVAPES